MANISVVKLKVRRGTDSQRRQIVFDQGELAFTTDSQRLFVGDGATLGGLSPAIKYYTINTTLPSTFIQTANFVQPGDIVYDIYRTNFYVLTGTINTDLGNYAILPIVTPGNYKNYGIGSGGGSSSYAGLIDTTTIHLAYDNNVPKNLSAAIKTGSITADLIDPNAKLGGATGAGPDRVFFENDQVVTTNYSITNGKNAMTAGPVTINSGITVTVPTGSTWTVV